MRNKSEPYTQTEDENKSKDSHFQNAFKVFFRHLGCNVSFYLYLVFASASSQGSPGGL